MKYLKENSSGIVLCLFELTVGILLLINPVSFTAGIITIAGIALMIMGLIEVVKYFRMRADEAMLSQALTKGLLSLLSGLFCAFKTEWFIMTFPVLTIIYGVLILVTGINKIQRTVDALRQKDKRWYWTAINALVTIACAVVILRSPFASTAVLWMFTGISLIVECVLDIITIIWGKKASQ